MLYTRSKRQRHHRTPTDLHKRLLPCRLGDGTALRPYTFFCVQGVHRRWNNQYKSGLYVIDSLFGPIISYARADCKRMSGLEGSNIATLPNRHDRQKRDIEKLRCPAFLYLASSYSMILPSRIVRMRSQRSATEISCVMMTTVTPV